jgi:hypothetical protein
LSAPRWVRFLRPLPLCRYKPLIIRLFIDRGGWCAQSYPQSGCGPYQSASRNVGAGASSITVPPHCATSHIAECASPPFRGGGMVHPPRHRASAIHCQHPYRGRGRAGAKGTFPHPLCGTRCRCRGSVRLAGKKEQKNLDCSWFSERSLPLPGCCRNSISSVLISTT